MGVPQSVREAYERSVPLLEELERYVRDTLNPYVNDHDYMFFGRIKGLESLSEKIETGRFRSWSELNDLYACSIVVPVSSHEQGVVRKLAACFTEVESKSRDSTEKSPEVFRYDGLRWYGRLPEDVAARRQPGLGTVIFEVQVRTAFEHAWQVVTHDLVYKADNVDWSRQRLASQLKASVEQIEMVIDAFESAVGAVRPSPWPAGALQDRVISFFRQLETDRLLPPTLVPVSWRRFSETFVKVVKRERLGENAEAKVDAALNLMNASLRGESGPPIGVSGSLLQYVYAVLANAGYVEAYRLQFVPDSPEMASIYGVLAAPRGFHFDGVAAPHVEVAADNDARGEESARPE